MNLTTVFIVALVLTAILVAWRLMDKRAMRRLTEENKIRAGLGLPLLSRADFEIKVVEKTVEYRGKINQHM